MCAAEISDQQSLKRKSVLVNLLNCPADTKSCGLGEFDNMIKANQRLAIVTPITVLAIVALLFGLFNSIQIIDRDGGHSLRCSGRDYRAMFQA